MGVLLGIAAGILLGVSDFIAKPLVPDTALAKLDLVKQSIAGSRRCSRISCPSRVSPPNWRRAA